MENIPQAQNEWPLFTEGVFEGKRMPLEIWLAFVLGPDRERVYPNNAFPSEEMRDEYLRGIGARSNDEVAALLRVLLVGEGTYGHDGLNLQLVDAGHRVAQPPDYMRRLRRFAETGTPVWDGIWWVLDLLPHSPKEAEDVIRAFFIAYGLLLPDNAAYGLSDALTVLRAKFMEQIPARATLLDLTSRDFEYLVSALYHDRGYETEVTRATRDGGVDVIARRDVPGAREMAVISAKRYDPDVPVSDVRELQSVQVDRRATKGVLVTTANRFTADAQEWAARDHSLELIPYGELATMLNQSYGPNWPARASQIVTWERRRLERLAAEAGA